MWFSSTVTKNRIMAFSHCKRYILVFFKASLLQINLDSLLMGLRKRTLSVKRFLCAQKIFKFL